MLKEQSIAEARQIARDILDLKRRFGALRAARPAGCGLVFPRAQVKTQLSATVIRWRNRFGLPEAHPGIGPDDVVTRDYVLELDEFFFTSTVLDDELSVMPSRLAPIDRGRVAGFST